MTQRNATCRSRNAGGFTLIELLVVIAIIGLLASIIVASLDQARVKARDARRKADLTQIANAINLFYSDHNYLPRNSNGWCTYISNPSNGWGAAFQSDLAPTYIAAVPLDPLHANQTGDYFYYNQNNTLGAFTLCAALETPTGNSYTSQFGGCSGWSTSYNYCVSYN